VAIKEANEKWLRAQLKILVNEDTTPKKFHEVIKKVGEGPKDGDTKPTKAMVFTQPDGTLSVTKAQSAQIMRIFLEERDVTHPGVDLPYVKEKGRQHPKIKNLGRLPDIEELRETIVAMKNGKAVLGIQPELLKLIADTNDDVMLQELLDLIIEHIKKGGMSIDEWKERKITFIEKGKGASHPNKLRGLTIMHPVKNSHRKHV
jgi:hypothetical protein